MFLTAYTSEDIWKYIKSGIEHGLKKSGKPPVPQRGRQNTYKNRHNKPWRTR